MCDSLKQRRYVHTIIFALIEYHMPWSICILLVLLEADLYLLLQIWELNSNGTMVNSYSGLCATVEYIEGKIL